MAKMWRGEMAANGVMVAKAYQSMKVSENNGAQPVAAAAA